jgi:hypothetical protein
VRSPWEQGLPAADCTERPINDPDKSSKIGPKPLVRSSGAGSRIEKHWGYLGEALLVFAELIPWLHPVFPGMTFAESWR